MVFVLWNDNSRRSSFIIFWWSVVLIPLVFPILGKHNYFYLNSKKPNIWMIISITFTICWFTLHIFASSFIQRTMDFFLCVNHQYTSTIIEAYNVSTNRRNQIIYAEPYIFKLDTSVFIYAKQYESYKVIYLPNSLYVIDIIDLKTGFSLLKNDYPFSSGH